MDLIKEEVFQNIEVVFQNIEVTAITKNEAKGWFTITYDILKTGDSKITDAPVRIRGKRKKFRDEFQSTIAEHCRRIDSNVPPVLKKKKGERTLSGKRKTALVASFFCSRRT